MEDCIGKEVDSYRAPGFSLNENVEWVIEELINCGFRYDSSIFSSSRAHGGNKSIIVNEPVYLNTSSGYIKEFPMSYLEILNYKIVYSGGGYFRLSPTFFN